MYEVIRPARGSRPEERRTFRTAAGLLRWALREQVFRHGIGGVPYPCRFGDIHLGYRDHDAGRDYHLIDTFTPWKITGDHLAAMRRAQARYGEIVHYLREIEPGWRPDVEATGNASGVIHYMDNSTVACEIDKYGNRRRRTIIAPHGDACF